jgi:hypothetical protein
MKGRRPQTVDEVVARFHLALDLYCQASLEAFAAALVWQGVPPQAVEDEIASACVLLDERKQICCSTLRDWLASNGGATVQ